MALFEYRDLGGTLLVEFTRGPSYPYTPGGGVNVDADQSPGGFVRAQVRGRYRRTWRLKFTWQPAATLAQYELFLQRYGGRAEPFLFVCPAGTYRVRLVNASTEWPEISYQKNEWEDRLVEDLV
jgi:hypothetical protein